MEEASITWSAWRSSGPMYSMALSRMKRLQCSCRVSLSSQETMYRAFLMSRVDMENLQSQTQAGS